MVDFVDINGASLAYRLVGPAQAPLFVTLHGGRGFGKSNEYLRIEKNLTKGAGDHSSDFRAYSPLQDVHRVLSFDFRGHGQSSETGPYTFSQLVDDIDAMRVQFAGPDSQIVLCGGSFGGYLAQEYAIKYPTRVSHLILRGTAPSFHRTSAPKQELQIG